MPLNDAGLPPHAGVTALTPSKPFKPDQSLGRRSAALGFEPAPSRRTEGYCLPLQARWSYRARKRTPTAVRFFRLPSRPTARPSSQAQSTRPSKFGTQVSGFSILNPPSLSHMNASCLPMQAHWSSRARKRTPTVTASTRLPSPQTARPSSQALGTRPSKSGMQVSSTDTLQPLAQT